jgi:beta-lactam-binding protein with PASTA domain
LVVRDGQENPPLRAWIPLPTVVTLVVVGLWFMASETPFGIGNGKVPSLVGRNMCAATQSLAKRGLRWHILGIPGIQEKAEHGSAESSFDCYDDSVVRQSPKAGAEVGEGGVVTFATVCSEAFARGGGCQ